MLLVNSVAIARGGRMLLQDVGFDLQSGDYVHLTGANGIGKSSLLRAIAGFLPVAAGAITLSGSEPADSIGYIGDLPGLKSAETLYENLRALTPIQTAGHVARPAIVQAADRVGCGHLLDVPVRYFSTGQTRRATLARLLLGNRPLWLLDEPFSGLDTEGRAVLDRMITAHRDGGGAVLLAHHGAADGACTLDLTNFVPDPKQAFAADIYHVGAISDGEESW